MFNCQRISSKFQFQGKKNISCKASIHRVCIENKANKIVTRNQPQINQFTTHSITNRRRHSTLVVNLLHFKDNIIKHKGHSNYNLPTLMIMSMQSQWQTQAKNIRITKIIVFKWTFLFSNYYFIYFYSSWESVNAIDWNCSSRLARGFIWFWHF